jgi:hypothetical protein
MSIRFKFPLLCILSLAAPLGCGPTEVGDDCDEVGDPDECEDGAICTNVSDSNNDGVCLWICDNNDHCPADHECNGVSGTNTKSCQPK